MLTLGQIVDLVGAKIKPDTEVARAVVVDGVATLDKAGPREMAFFFDPKRRNELETCKAAAVLLQEPIEEAAFVQLIHPYPQEALALVGQQFYRYQHSHHGISLEARIHPTAQVHPRATVYPWAFVDEGAVIGAGCVIYPYVYIGRHARIGEETTIFPGAVIMQECEVGDRVIVHPNAVIGADGFGFFTRAHYRKNSPGGQGRYRRRR
jgi:UDP-3-O-[3-hydroxymyristoyl] glucosamine N-acyltransferase